MNEKNSEKEMRLVKFISNCGVASRRKAGDLVANGDIIINDAVCYDMSYKVKEGDIVKYLNKTISLESRKYYIMLNKPRGYVCTNSDIHAEKKAIDLIKLQDENIRLYSAGRLDKDSEGMIIFSNDGDLVAKLTHPSNQIQKRYEVTTLKPLTKTDIYNITSGKILDEDDFLKAEKVELISALDNRYLFILTEGKKREIRRLVKCCNNNVKRLKRIAVGKLELDKLKVGTFRELTNGEVNLLTK